MRCRNTVTSLGWTSQDKDSEGILSEQSDVERERRPGKGILDARDGSHLRRNEQVHSHRH
jgi:hypothetical protein